MNHSPRLPKFLGLFAVMIVLAMLTAACAEQASLPGTDAARASLDERQANFLEALSERDAEEVSGFFAEDGVVHIANIPPVVGRPTIQQLYQNVFQALVEADYDREHERLSVGGDLAWEGGSVTTVFAAGDESVTFPGKYLMIWELNDGTWQVAAFSISNNSAE